MDLFKNGIVDIVGGICLTLHNTVAEVWAGHGVVRYKETSS